MAQATTKKESTSQSPMVWLIIGVIAIVMVFVFFSDRTNTKTVKISLDANPATPKFTQQAPVIQKQEDTLDAKVSEVNALETVEEKPVVLTARELIRHSREQKRPYPFEALHAEALARQTQGNMADAYLLFFFNAREGYLPSILKMGEMADPINFDATKSLLSNADPIQAFKWYRIAIDRENEEAQVKMDTLYQWAIGKADEGNAIAQQLLLNFAK